jgi:hypothetical protein
MKSQRHTVTDWDVSLWFAPAQSANRRSAGLHRCVSFVEVEGANDYNRRLRNKRV